MTLAALLAQPGRAAAAAVTPLASGVVDYQVLDAHHALVESFEGKFSVLDLDHGTAVPWQCPWNRQKAGWDKRAKNDTALTNFAVSPDGKLVALALRVSTSNGAARRADAAPLFVEAVLLCAADGGSPRCVALADETDGGPPLYFTQDSKTLVGPEYDPCEPTPQGLRDWYKGMDSQSAAELPPVDAVDTASGRRLALPALAQAAWLEKCPYSDDFAYAEMDTPTVHYGSLAGPQAGLTGAFTPPDGQDGFTQAAWAAPGLQLCWLQGRQVLVTMDGKLHPAAAGRWACYVRLPDGRSFFSRDGGRSIELGQVDWLGGAVSGAQARPDLQPYAVPLDAAGWPDRVDNWKALPDSSGALVLAPGEGILALVR
jgi:hypothetical protein